MGLRRELDRDDLRKDEDWVGNNAAFTCPHCGTVFLVSGRQHGDGRRRCPGCEKSEGFCDVKGKKAWIES